MKSRTTSEIKEELSKPLEEKKPLSIQAMRMLVHVEMRRRQKSDEPQLNCIVIDGDNKEKYESFVENMKKMAAETDKPARFQVVIKNEAHYTAIDIHLSKEGNKFFLLDAANDRRGTRRNMMLEELKNDNGTPFFSESYMATGSSQNGGNIQKDFRSCPAFTLDHVCQVSKIDNIYDILKQKASNGIVQWIDLPPSLVWNVQSMRVAEIYTNNQLNFVSKFYSEGVAPDDKTMEKRLAAGYEFDDHIKAAQKMEIINGQEKAVNGSVEASFATYRKKALSYMDRHDEKSINRIVNAEPNLQVTGRAATVISDASPVRPHIGK